MATTRRVFCHDVDWVVEDIDIPGQPDFRFWDSWERGEFEPETLAAIDRFVRPGSTFIDVGAWVGNVSLWAARLGAHVIAIEPDPAAADVLRRNTAANYATITVFEGAISDTTGTCHIKPHSDGWGSSMTHVTSSGTEVPCLTLPDLFDIYDVGDCAIVKMDIEGHESVVLEHAAPFLAKCKIPLLVSMHQPWWSNNIDPTWFDDYGDVSGEIGGWGQLLCVP